MVKKEVSTGNNILACPICFGPFSLIGDRILSLDSTTESSLHCNNCKKTYFSEEAYLELTLATGPRQYAGETLPLVGTQMFRTRWVSHIYERGWRQKFALAGFPGSDEEFDMMKKYLEPVLGGNIVDASCGSGLFSRLFAKSGLFSLVVALDYSENMLKQCYGFVQQEENFPKEKLTLVRADISRLPFATSSIDAVHAGAAIHCWPSPTGAVAEISRVLRPGGVFVGTTFLIDEPFSFIQVMKIFCRAFKHITGVEIFHNESDLEDICAASGLVGFTSLKIKKFVMFSAAKPS